jgi:hypothetical protein
LGMRHLVARFGPHRNRSPIPETIAHCDFGTAAAVHLYLRPESATSGRLRVKKANLAAIDNVADCQPLDASPIPAVKHDPSRRELDPYGRAMMTGHRRNTVLMLGPRE